MNPLFRIDFSISDSLKIVRKSVLIYDTIISVTEIARLEGVTKASVSLSLARAIKKISKKFAAGLKNS